jgi:immune inhibitor A
MKKLAIIMSAAMVLTSAFSFGKAPTANEKEVPSSLRAPIFQKLDPEITKVAREKGVKVKGEGAKQFNVNGKSYLRPEANTGVLPNKDMTGSGKKGIAILVDFPNNEDGTSAVPGVNYPQVPQQKFDDLLNGTKYNPYDLDVFKNLATYKGEAAPTDRTMKNYYNEVSYNNFGIDVEVVDWVTLPKPYSYYLKQGKYYNDNGDAHIGELVYDAIKAADEHVNFADYAVDIDPKELWYYEEDGTPYTLEDGNKVEKIVPNIFIIHRGTGAEFSTDPSIIWSHKWDIMSAKYYGYYYQNGTYMNEKDLKYTTVDGVAVNTYNICPEVGRDISGYLKNLYPPEVIGPDYKGSAPAPAYVGVYAHEFGHVLGLPDQYDYGYDSEGTGMYTLMAGGSYGRNLPSAFYSGNSPVHMDAWSKMYLGFVQPKVITAAKGKKQSITLRPSSEEPDIYKVDVPGSNGREYFLLENRQQKGFDEGLSYTIDGANVHGLAVYHIVNDILARTFNRPNEAANWDTDHTGKNSLKQFTSADNDEYHYGISVIQADGNYDMEKYVNDGDSGDLFPGKNKVTSISSKGNAKVNTTSLYKWGTKSTETGIVIENIKENNDGTVTCDVVFTK